MKKSINKEHKFAFIYLELDARIELAQEMVAKEKQKLSTDFIYNAQFMVESIYKKEQHIKYLAEMKECFTENAHEALLEMYSHFLSKDFNVVTNSTNVVTRITSTWLYQVKIEMKTLLEAFIHELDNQSKQ